MIGLVWTSSVAVAWSKRSLSNRVETKLRKRLVQSSARGGDASDDIAKVAELKGGIESLESRIAILDQELRFIELRLPNVPEEDVPVGADESANRVGARGWHRTRV